MAWGRAAGARTRPTSTSCGPRWACAPRSRWPSSGRSWGWRGPEQQAATVAAIDDQTRRQPTAPPPPPPPSRSGLNPLTLAIAAISAVAAALVVSQLWPAGTIWATAMTPVVVSVVKEALERPAQKITQVGVVGRYHHDPDELVVEEVEPGASEPSERRLYGVRRHKWRIAVVTGLLAAAVAIAALTLPELVAGRSIVSGGKKTTVLGGHRHKAKQQTTTTTVETVTQTQTETTTT